MSEASITSVESVRRVTRPDFAFMRPRLSRWIAFGAGAGLSGVAPGTAGTLWAWVAWSLFAPCLSDAVAGLLLAMAFVIGCWACGRTAAAMGVHDHGAIVWDEIVAFWLVLWIAPSGFGWQLAAFVLFRVFDIIKPPPIRQVDAWMRGGLGVMLDDLLAAAYALLVLAVCKAW
jgi:phosphatidylglycerophosphatase A